MSSLIVANYAVLPGGLLEKGPLYIEISNGTIVQIHSERPHSLRNCINTHLVTPGFIDIHTHGFGGAEDVTDFWLNPGFTLRQMPRAGTTSCLASIVFPENFKLNEFKEMIRNYVGHVSPGMATLEGIHAEGPIINDCGGLPEGTSEMSLEEFVKLVDDLSPSLKVMTISPHVEAKHGYARLKALLDRGVTPALGHDRVATETEIIGAMRQSNHTPLHITHLFNVSSFNHRSPSLVNFGLANSLPPNYKDIHLPTIEVIGDLAHVHPMTLHTLVKARGFQDICMITDSVFLSTTPGEKISYNGRKLIVSPNCKTMILEGTETIAGSCCTMLDIFNNLIHTLHIPIQETVTMMTENPARVAGLDHVGKLAVGQRADLLLFDDSYTLLTVIINGNIAWSIKEDK